MTAQTPEQGDAQDIIEALKRDRQQMIERRQRPVAGTCPEHAMLLESSEHDKTAQIWIIRRLDLTDRELLVSSPVNLKGIAAVIIGLQAIIEAVKAVL